MSDLLNRLKRLPKEKRAHLLKHLRSDVEKNHLQKPELVRRERGTTSLPPINRSSCGLLTNFPLGAST